MSETKLILIVDDDESIREILVEVLASAGFAALAVSSAFDALNHIARSGPPALVLMDLTMPLMDGRQLLAERRKSPTLSQVPFVLLTANPNVSATELGAAEVLVKPIGMEDLLSVARRYASTDTSGTFSAAADPLRKRNGDR
jgi:CheY-like chemotaxis protein